MHSKPVGHLRRDAVNQWYTGATEPTRTQTGTGRQAESRGRGGVTAKFPNTRWYQFELGAEAFPVLPPSPRCDRPSLPSNQQVRNKERPYTSEDTNARQPEPAKHETQGPPTMLAGPHTIETTSQASFASHQ